MNENVVGYGTLIMMHYREHPVVVEVEGFKRIYSPNPAYGFDYPFVIKKAGSKVRAILLAGLSPSRLETLDLYEGVPHLYERVDVPVMVVAGTMPSRVGAGDAGLHAWIYVPSPRTLSLSLDRAFKEMRKNHVADYLDMMDRDLWLEKVKEGHQNIVDMLPDLFIDPAGCAHGSP